MSNYRDNQQTHQRKMIINGQGLVSVTPDLASVRIGVQSNAESVAVAQEENARISQNVINSLKDLDVAEIQTVLYQLDKIYDYQNGERIDLGYQVRNVLDVKTGEMSLLGTIIDTAVQNGANIVEAINFEVLNQEIYYQQALIMAVKNAIEKANHIATSLKNIYKPIPILITENRPGPTPFPRTIAFREGDLATPIEPGTNDIEATVTIEFLF